MRALLALMLAAAAPSAPQPERYMSWTMLPTKVFALSPDVAGHAGGHDSASLHSKGAPKEVDTGVVYAVYGAKAYRGKRVRVRFWGSAPAVGTWAGVFARPANPQADSTTLVGVRTAPVAGGPWKRYDVVVDVEADDSVLVVGGVLRGKGDLRLDPPTFEVVGTDVPLSRPAWNTNDQPAALDLEDGAQEGP